MGHDWTVETVFELPKCAYCDDAARYNSMTVYGHRANMCVPHWGEHSTRQLGIGHGQRLYLPTEH